MRRKVVTLTKEIVQRRRAERAQKQRDNDLLLEEIWADYDAKEMKRLKAVKLKLEASLAKVNKGIEKLSGA